MRASLLVKKNIEGYAFILPGMIYMLALLGYPLVYNFILGFRDVDVKTFRTGSDVFVGLSNYIYLFREPVFRLVFRNTIVFTLVCIAVQFTVGFLLALFFSKKFTFAGPIRGIILIAYMMPMSVVAFPQWGRICLVRLG
jgi:multiple sugar transport system permease protein